MQKLRKEWNISTIKVVFRSLCNDVPKVVRYGIPLNPHKKNDIFSNRLAFSSLKVLTVNPIKCYISN